MSRVAVLGTDMHIAFDLDGTLIDSAESIINALNYALDTTKTIPVFMPTTSLIGPPILEILQELCPDKNALELQRIVHVFQQYYDQYEALNFRVFPLVEELLRNLKSGGGTLHIVTNKRRCPTEKILVHAGWEKFFSSVFSIDDLPPAKSRSKSQLIHYFLYRMGVPARDCLYIGDRLSDKIAAEENGVQFLLVGWGYG
jgi:phosphoglycolate phosphatase